MASYGTRFYIELVNDAGTVCNWSQLDKPTLPELRAMARCALDIGPVALRKAYTAVGPYVDDFECSSVQYGVADAGTKQHLRYWLNVELRPNDPSYTDAFGRQAPESTDEQAERYQELWQEYAPARCK